MTSQLRYAAICADLTGRQNVKIGTYENQPHISESEFKKIKLQLLYINPNLKISKKQAQILYSQDTEVNLLLDKELNMTNFICRNDIKKICNKVEPGFDLQSEAKLFIQPLIKKTLRELILICDHLLKICKRKTLSQSICESATQLLLTKELSEHAILYAQRAIRMYHNKYQDTDSKGKSRSWKSDLIISVYKIKVNIDHFFKRSSDTAGVYLAAVVEYLLMELATLCAESTESNMASKVLLEMVIDNDKDFSNLFYRK